MIDNGHGGTGQDVKVGGRGDWAFLLRTQKIENCTGKLSLGLTPLAGGTFLEAKC